MRKIKEDTHFYLDNAPPEEVTNVLTVLSLDYDLTPKEISDTLRDNYVFERQKHYTYSLQKLFNLGLSIQSRKCSGIYRLSELSSKVQNIIGVDTAILMDLIHYLHYILIHRKTDKRKYLWSFKR
ncbi:MAG: hypothetical protein EHM85_03400 [Desulfobacteraceae bacterium]|nr:MAG: hypothetical protein EHM85_03400 [Desulfobacteraceae bacterium]